MSLAYITHESCVRHQMGAHHPEQPARLAAIEQQLEISGLMSRLQRYQAGQASREQLAYVHSSAHLDAIYGASAEEALHWLDPDTAMNEHSLEAALCAAGANVLAVDLVMTGKVRRAFCAVRPPGHHAERHKAMGFCLFNNIAVAAAHAIHAHGLQRVAIVDFDVHHGNGTENIFSGNDKVLFCSSFQHPFYPGSGFDTEATNIINLPLPAGTDGITYRAAVSEGWLAALDQFAPQLVLVSAGFDGHREDPLAQFNLVEDDYTWITRELSQLAERHAGGRMVSTLEGGYHLEALGRSVNAHLEGLLD